MITSLIIGLGVDYNIHIIQRFREEIKSSTVSQAMEKVVEHTGSALFISLLTTMSGFIVMYFSFSPLAKQFGIIASIAMLGSFVLSIVLTPLLLSYYYRNKSPVITHN